MLARAEFAELSKRLMNESIANQGVVSNKFTLHSDRGSPMIAKPVTHLLADLGVTKSHSRPHVSNDNPYSESQFRTLKYRPDFPDRFGSFEDAQAHCQRFMFCYNEHHRHSGIGYHTPTMFTTDELKRFVNYVEQYFLMPIQNTQSDLLTKY